MKPSALLLATAGVASALTQQCSGTAKDEGGNWFCGAVDHILYQGIGGKGSFKAVTNMDNNGNCIFEDNAYKGPLAPLDSDVSLIPQYSLSHHRTNIKWTALSSPPWSHPVEGGCRLQPLQRQ